VWQCNKRFKEKGVKGCRGESIHERDLYRAFLLAWNELLAERKLHLAEWNRQIKEGNPLEQLRAKQMIELTEEPPLTQIVPELVQLVLERVEIMGDGQFEFYFMDGTERKVTVLY
jgi:hypothetical protein